MLSVHSDVARFQHPQRASWLYIVQIVTLYRDLCCTEIYLYSDLRYTRIYVVHGFTLAKYRHAIPRRIPQVSKHGA